MEEIDCRFVVLSKNNKTNLISILGIYKERTDAEKDMETANKYCADDEKYQIFAAPYNK